MQHRLKDCIELQNIDSKLQRDKWLMVNTERTWDGQLIPKSSKIFGQTTFQTTRLTESQFRVG